MSSSLWGAVTKVVNHVASLPNKTEAEAFIKGLSELTNPPRTRNEKGTNSRTRSASQDYVNEDDVLLGDRIVAGSPGICRLDRKDSGISIGSNRSNNSSLYDNARSGQFIRQGSGRSSGYRSLQGSGRMQRIAENETTSRRRITRKPSRSVKNVRWIKLPNSKIKSEYFSQFMIGKSDFVNLYHSHINNLFIVNKFKMSIPFKK